VISCSSDGKRAVIRELHWSGNIVRTDPKNWVYVRQDTFIGEMVESVKEFFCFWKW